MGGSPPHTWGILNNLPSLGDLIGFTPTHVGNTYSDETRDKVLAVHPHTRGEYHMDEIELWSQDGSPPHTWGIP